MNIQTSNLTIGLPTKSVRFGQKPLSKKIQSIFGRASKEGERLYLMARRQITTQTQKFRKSGRQIDVETYKKIVHDVVESLTPNDTYLSSRIQALSDYFVDEFGKPVKSIRRTPKSN